MVAAIIYCMVCRSLGESSLEESEEVLWHGGSINGLASLGGPGTFIPLTGIRGVPGTICRAWTLPAISIAFSLLNAWLDNTNDSFEKCMGPNGYGLLFEAWAEANSNPEEGTCKKGVSTPIPKGSALATGMYPTSENSRKLVRMVGLRNKSSLFVARSALVRGLFVLRDSSL
ncbi:UNVERIFIED_CONTAM: hypothetical protein Sradi_3837500 [Sesamum radiatum]|uniref:Uncharacterized protein n=1 Tax=Sesamum radiatum TaxID=300843 RepID=A0AAW2Q1N6_SESRA